MEEEIYQFCPKCRGQLQKKAENLLACTQCSFRFYINPKACNAVILENEHGKMLLVKRKDEPRKGYWDLPGGFVDLEETYEESAIREVKEELGLVLQSVQYTSSYIDRYLYDGVNYFTICSVFTAQLPNSKITPADDITEAKFFAYNKLPFADFAFEGMVRGVKEYIAKKQSLEHQRC